MLKGGTTSFEVVSTRELEVLAILMGEGGGGGTTSFHPLKKRGGGGAKRPVIFPFCSPSSPRN